MLIFSVSAGNPRKMVKTWAEKEMRNLTRLQSAGIPCPDPIILRSHVLVMGFIGHEGWAAPLLKDVNISESKARELYLICVRIMRNLYWKAKLVHADLSEFNILYNIVTDELFIIDVSQSVEHDHPSALLFLRKDCANINDFFRKHNVCVMSVKELFDFVTDPLINDDNIESYLDRAQEIAANRTDVKVTQKDLIDEEVFKKVFIPRTLDEVIDFERDQNKATQSDLENIYYTNITGMNKNLTGTKFKPDILESENPVEVNNSRESEHVSSYSESSSSEDNEAWQAEDTKESAENIKTKKELRKENKKFVKEENREKRKTKMPKHVKKRKEKVTKGRKKK